MKGFLMKLAKNRVKNSLKNESGNSDLGILSSPLFRRFLFGGTGFLFFLLIIVVLALIIFGPLMLAGEYLSFRNDDNSSFFSDIDTSDWCSGDDCVKDSDQKYYEKLYEVYSSYMDDGITIDTDLITGTIYYGTSLNNGMFDLDDGSDSDDLEDGGIHLSDIKKLASNMISGSSTDYTKYRNYLIDTYIPKRFSDLYNSDDQKEKIADEIMMFASMKMEKESNLANSCVTYNCNNVFLTGDYAGEYTLEEYVKGVVNAESGFINSFTNNYKEQWKAQAIAARSMVLKQYDICNESVPNTGSFQVFKPNWPQELSDVVDETAGMVLTYNDDIFLAQYDAFYEGNGSNYYCDDNLCYSTYYIRGSGNQSNWDTHVISTYSKYTSSFAPYPNGHGIGMSQWGAAYLADIGKNYDDILKYYYADEIQISKVGNSCSVNTDIASYDWRQADPRWGWKSYGDTTLGAVGCNFTSIIIEIARSGKSTVLPDFNPGTAFDFMKSKGYLGKNGATLSYSAFSELAPDFRYSGEVNMAGFSHDKIISTVASLVDNNKYPIIFVQSGNSKPYSTTQHWVAIVGYTDNDVEIIDPAKTGCTRLFTCKPGMDKSNGYAVASRIIYWE